LMTVFPELERYWITGEVGPHLKQWRTGRTERKSSTAR
jgi:hypothetical protein